MDINTDVITVEDHYSTGEQVFRNEVVIKGFLSEEFKYNHFNISSRKYFYKSYLEVMRNNGNIDKIPVMIGTNSPEWFERKKFNGKFLTVKGFLFSYLHKIQKDGKQINWLEVYVKAETIECTDSDYDDGLFNLIKLRGYISKPSSYELTNYGLEKYELFVATKRDWSRTKDFVLCFALGAKAEYFEAMELKQGDEVEITGTIRCREYYKKDLKTRVPRVEVKILYMRKIK